MDEITRVGQRAEMHTYQKCNGIFYSGHSVLKARIFIPFVPRGIFLFIFRIIRRVRSLAHIYLDGREIFAFFKHLIIFNIFFRPTL